MLRLDRLTDRGRSALPMSFSPGSIMILRITTAKENFNGILLTPLSLSPILPSRGEGVSAYFTSSPPIGGNGAQRAAEGAKLVIQIYLQGSCPCHRKWRYKT